MTRLFPRHRGRGGARRGGRPSAAARRAHHGGGATPRLRARALRCWLGALDGRRERARGRSLRAAFQKRRGPEGSSSGPRREGPRAPHCESCWQKTLLSLFIIARTSILAPLSKKRLKSTRRCQESASRARAVVAHVWVPDASRAAPAVPRATALACRGSARASAWDPWFGANSKLSRRYISRVKLPRTTLVP